MILARGNPFLIIDLNIIECMEIEVYFELKSNRCLLIIERAQPYNKILLTSGGSIFYLVNEKVQIPELLWVLYIIYLSTLHLYFIFYLWLSFCCNILSEISKIYITGGNDLHPCFLELLLQFLDFYNINNISKIFSILFFLIVKIFLDLFV